MNTTECRNQAARLFVRGDFEQGFYEQAKELRQNGYTLEQLARAMWVSLDVWRISAGPKEFPAQLQGVGITHIRRAVSLNFGRNA